MREEKVSYFAGSAAVSTWQFIVPMRSFLKIDRQQAIRECPEADPVLISDKLGRYRISDQTGDSCGKLTARAACAGRLRTVHPSGGNVRKKRVGFPLGESCGCLKKFLGTVRQVRCRYPSASTRSASRFTVVQLAARSDTVFLCRSELSRIKTATRSFAI